MKGLTAMLAILAALACGGANLPPIQTVFVVVMENYTWSVIKDNTNDAPFINQTLLPMASWCSQFYNPPGVHPSLPNYLWMEAGTNSGIVDDNDPILDHQNTTNHLSTQLAAAGISWKTYQESITGLNVPLTTTGLYAARHNPFVYFDDITGTNDPNNAYGIAHIRPYSELASDLTNNTVARYNFITPNVCDDMHDCGVRAGDDWLAAEVPKILQSQAYQNNGALFIAWDEGAGDGPIGMILLSPLARGGGYCCSQVYTHSSTLRTMQEIFGLSPWLGDAANARDLADLFAEAPPTFAGFGFGRIVRLPDGAIELTAMGLTAGRTNVVEASADLASWLAICTNCAATNTFKLRDYGATNLEARFYRLVQLP